MVDNYSKVASYRKFIGYTQSEMANRLGISRNAYWRKENGRTAFNDSEKMVITELVAHKMPGVTIEEIFFS